MTKQPSLAQRLQELRCVIFDVEGVLSLQSRAHQPSFTENLILEEDRHAIKTLIKEGFIVGVISSGRSSLMKKNLLDLGVKWIYMGADLKVDAYEEIKSLCHLTDQQCAHMGDGLADLPVFEKVGFSVTVPHACPSIKKAADYCTKKQGAWGAAGEFVDLIFYYQRGCH